MTPFADDDTDMAGAAQLAGVHYDTFRKHWRAWAGLDKAGPNLSLPLPYRFPLPGQKRGAYRWRVEPLRAWRIARETALGEGRIEPAPAKLGRPRNDNSPRLIRDRAALARFMET